jgi:two-component system, LuxR family, sensor kinase FixL
MISVAKGMNEMFASPDISAGDEVAVARETYIRLAQLCWTLQSGNKDACAHETGLSHEHERVQVLEEIVQLNRIMSMGQLAASLAHELAQPLAAIRANTQAAERLASLPEPDLGEIRAALADIADDGRRAETVVQNIRAVFQKRQIAARGLDLNTVVNDVVRLIRHNAELRGVRIRLLLSTQPVLVEGDQAVLQQILLNLVNNGMDAMDAMPRHKKVLVLTTRVLPDTGYGSILVADNGSGVSKEDRSQLFTPFFTTKSKGLGIGLSICQALVESLNGCIRLDDRPGPGTAFAIELPLAVEGAGSRAA